MHASNVYLIGQIVNFQLEIIAIIKNNMSNF